MRKGAVNEARSARAGIAVQASFAHARGAALELGHAGSLRAGSCWEPRVCLVVSNDIQRGIQSRHPLWIPRGRLVLFFLEADVIVRGALNRRFLS